MLENKDISLVHSMISLGSCTMKLTSTTEMMVRAFTYYALFWFSFSFSFSFICSVISVSVLCVISYQILLFYANTDYVCL